MKYEEFTTQEIEVLKEYFEIECDGDTKTLKITAKDKFNELCIDIQSLTDNYANCIGLELSTIFMKSLIKLHTTILEVDGDE